MPRRPRLRALLIVALALAGAGGTLRAQSDSAALTPVPAPQSASSSSAQTLDDDDFDDYATLKVSDPFEGINRRVFKFNDMLYTRVLSPAVKGYEYVVRPPVNRAIANFYDNLRYPVRLVANLAQLKVDRAGRETGKFAVNTVAFLGFFRTAEHVPALAGVPREDLGQALGYWGVPHGPYIVVPVLGGASLRDYTGRLGENVVSPTGWDYINLANLEWLDALDLRWQFTITGTDVMSGLPASLKLYTDFKQAAVDPYLSVRDATRRYRDRETTR